MKTVLLAVLNLMMLILTSQSIAYGNDVYKTEENFGSIWRLVANSDIVAKVKLKFPLSSIKMAILGEKGEYVDIKVQYIDFYKGKESDQPEVIRMFVGKIGREKKQNIDFERIQVLNDKEVLVFLTKSENELYFTSFRIDPTEDSIRHIDFALVDEIRQEIINQEITVKDFLKKKATFAYEKEVKKLIEEMLNPKKAVSAYRALEMMGIKAVPAIISNMNDRRELPIQSISLENKSEDSFEASRHYSPDVVIDALAVILNQITDESFGFIYNGATEYERKKEYYGWIVWLSKQKK